MTDLFAQYDLDATARLVFAGERLVALPKLAGMIETALEQRHPMQMEDVTLTAMMLQGDDVAMLLDLSFEGDETILEIGLCHAHSEAAPARLALVCYALARSVPLTSVIWGRDGPRVPREHYVRALAPSFPQVQASVAGIAPRRVNAAVTRVPPTSVEDMARLAASGAQPAPEPGPTVRAGDTRYDAHVSSYEQHMRNSMRAPDAAPEDTPPRPTLPAAVRLSAWALSLSAAAISLPVATPVLACNLLCGEDLRAAGLTLGLAGFFLALDGSGAMALVF